MANFAEITNGVVTRVVVISNDDITGADGVEQEQSGIELCNAIVGPGTWVQTSFNNNFRKMFGQPGFVYVPDSDVFYNPVSPFPSWTLDENYDWQAPVPYPTDGQQYSWDEDSQQWVAVVEEYSSPQTPSGMTTPVVELP